MNDLVISEETLWQGGFFRVKRQKVRGSDGKYFFRELASRRDAVAVVPVQADGRVVMIREYAAGARQSLLFIPGGQTEATSESARQQEAQKELREEIGFRANKLVKLWQTFAAPSMLECRTHVYLGFDLVPDPLPNPDDGVIEPVVITIEEALQLLRQPDGSSATMIGALYLARDYLAQHSLGRAPTRAVRSST